MPVARDLPRDVYCAASALLAPLLTGPPRRMRLVATTRVSRHYETGDPALPGMPTLSVVTPAAVRLPDSVVVDGVENLPRGDVLRTGGGEPADAEETASSRDTVGWLRVTRWWRTARPSRLAPPPDLGAVARAEWRVRDSGAPALHVLGLHGVLGDLRERGELDPFALLGAGPGLTPAGDDVLAAALVTARATADPRLTYWRERTRRALDTRTTTVVSRGLLTHALQGYAVPPLADFLTALCTPDEPAARVGATLDRLLAVGHSSGAALATGVLHTLATRPAVAAA